MLIILMVICFIVGFFAAELTESEKLYKRKEYERRRDLRLKFERQMHNLRTFGNIEGVERNSTGKNI